MSHNAFSLKKVRKYVLERVHLKKKPSGKESAEPNSQDLGNSSEELSVVERIRRSLECTICTDLLLDPVGLDCGHVFCLHCLAHDFARRADEQVVCCVCRDGNSKSVSIMRSMRDVVEAAFPTEIIHRRQTLTYRDKTAITTMYNSLSKSPARQQLQEYLNHFRVGAAVLIIFLFWFFLGG